MEGEGSMQKGRAEGTATALRKIECLEGRFKDESKEYVVSCSDGKSAEFLIEVAKSEIAAHADAFNQLDSKVGVLLGFALVAIVQLVGSILRVLPDGQSMSSLYSYWVVYPLGFGLLLLVFATVLGILERWPRTFQDGASLKDLMEEPNPVDQLRIDALANLQFCVDQNIKINEKKVSLTKWCTVLVCAAMLTFLISASALIFLPSSRLPLEIEKMSSTPEQVRSRVPAVHDRHSAIGLAKIYSGFTTADKPRTLRAVLVETKWTVELMSETAQSVETIELSADTGALLTISYSVPR